MKFCILLVVLGLCRMAFGEWKPAARAGGALMTRFARDVDPKNVLPEYPRPQMVRKEWKNLNGLWDHKAGDESGQILVPFCIESALSGVGKHFDKFAYRRTFEVAREWKDKRVLLNFGAVDYECIVKINGKEVGRHVGGYDAFSFDITDALKPDGTQEIEVAVTDTTAETQARGKQITEPKGIWYTPVSGIWQTVWLEPVDQSYIQSIVITPDVDHKKVRVGVNYAGVALSNAQFHVEVLDGEKVIARHGTAGDVAEIDLPHPVLWSPDSPHLYGLRIRYHDKVGNVRDEIESYFGMRKIEVSPDDKGVPRIKLNGKVVLQIGPLDQGWWPDGLYTAPTDEALKYDLDITKKLGFNMIRKHVKIEPQRWYYWADKLGFLVWQDMPNAMVKEGDAWKKQFEAEIKAMVDQHRNSPSIIMWVPLNEGWGQGPYGKEGTIKLTNWVKQLDPTRLVNNTSGWTDSGSGDVHDIHNYPGPAAPPIEKTRAIVLGEFGGLGLPIEKHLWQSDKNWGYQNMGSRDELTDRYVRLLGRLWQLMENEGLCAGVYTQTTDVEGEVNGLMTYDREVIKLDESRTRDANLGKGPRIDVVALIKTAREEPTEWKYTTDKPADDWNTPAFNDSAWKTGRSGFGTNGTPGSTVNTKWATPDIWLRREVDLSEEVIKEMEVLWHHDERAELYINGVLACRSGQITTDYVEQRINDAARKAIKPGKNVIAVHCNQTTGGQYIDVGFVRLIEIQK